MSDDDPPSAERLRIERSVFEQVVLSPRKFEPLEAKLSEVCLLGLRNLAAEEKFDVASLKLEDFLEDAQSAAYAYYSCQVSGADQTQMKANFTAIATRCRAIVSAYEEYNDAYIDLTGFAQYIMNAQPSSEDLGCAEDRDAPLLVRIFRPPTLEQEVLRNFLALADKADVMARKMSKIKRSNDSFQRAFVLQLGLAWIKAFDVKPTQSRSGRSSAFSRAVETIHQALKIQNPGVKIPMVGPGNLRAVVDHIDELGDHIEL